MPDRTEFADSRRARLLRALPWLIVAVALACSLAVWEFSRLRDAELARTEFDQLVTRVAESIKRRMDANEQVLRSVEGLFDASAGVDRQEFRRFVAAMHLEANYPGIQGVGYSLLIPSPQLAAHVRAVRGEGFADYAVRPAGEREFYSSIIYLEPFDWRNKRAFGYDMYSEPVRHKAMARAAETGRAALSGRVTLVQETDTDVQAGVLLYVPVYSGEGVPDSVEQRRRRLIGWAYSPLRMKDTVDGMLDREQVELRELIAIRIFDGRSLALEQLLYGSDSQPAAERKGLSAQRSLVIAGQEWTLAAAPRPAFMEKVSRPGRVTLAAELSVIWLLAILALTLLRGHRRLSSAMVRVEQANRENEQRRKWLQSIFDASSVGVFFVDPQGVITVANRRMGEMFGVDAAHLVGREYVSLIHPVEREAGRVNVRRLLGNAVEQIDIERRYWRGDQTEFWGHLTGRRVSESDGLVLGLVGVIADISPRREAERALRESEERYRLIADNSSDVIWLMDLASRRFTYVSPSVERMRGWTAEEVTAQPIEAALTADSATRVGQGLTMRLARLAAGDAAARFAVTEIDQPCKDGRIIQTEVASTVLLDGDGRPAQLLGLTRDITERKRIEAELERHRNHLEELVAARTEDLARALDAAEAASRAKSVFLANMSHELRTPMNAIMGMTNLALRRITDPRVAEQLTKGLDAARHLLALIDNLLDIANFEAGRVVLKPAPFSLARLVDEALQGQDTPARAKGLSLAAEVAHDMPDELVGDAGRLRQILLNFLGNAVKFSERGEIRLSVTQGGENADGVALRFEVADQGLGMSPDARERLFQLFSQGDESITRAHGGTGLGLVIARRIARLMGGDVGVDSEQGLGSRFWFSVRLRRLQ